MPKKSEKPPVCMVRKGNYLVPDMQMDMDALASVAQGERVRVDIRQWRSIPRLRAYWAMLGDVVKATDCAPTVEALHELIKLETHHVIHVRLGNGMKVALPGSIAFDKAAEAEMVAFFRDAEAFLASEYGWTGQEQAA